MRPSLVLHVGVDAPDLMFLFAAGRLVQAEPALPDWVLSGYAEDLII